MKEIHDRFNSGKETLEDLLNYYPNFKMKIEYKGKEKNIEVVEKKYYQKLINIVKKQNKAIEEMAETICIYRGYAITKPEDIQTLKDRIIQEYFEKKGKVNK